MRAPLLLCALLLIPAVAPAADSDNRFAMKGAGFLPCQVLVTEREKRSNAYYMIGGWIEGYTSAYNKLNPDTYDVLAFESLEMLLVVMDQHCASNPNDRLYAVLDSMIAKIAAERIREESPRIEVVAGERKAHLYRETIRRVQAELKKRGLYKDETDGRYTDATRSAIIAFQTDIGFEATGFPDQATLWRLLRK